MKKAELEQKLIELDKKIAILEARPVCYGHYCNCNHVCTLPHYPNIPYGPNTTPWYTGPTWSSGGTTLGGLTDKNAETTTFGKINS